MFIVCRVCINYNLGDPYSNCNLLLGIVFNGWTNKIVNLNWNKKLKLRERAAYEIEGALVNTLRDTLQGLLNAAQIPSGATSWLNNNSFDTFMNILDFLFNYLGWN
jgi:hypothetical protein